MDGKREWRAVVERVESARAAKASLAAAPGPARRPRRMIMVPAWALGVGWQGVVS